MYFTRMNALRLACLLLAAPAALLAQLNVGGSDDQQQQAPEEIPDFSGLNEYIYVPKTTMYFGERLITGVKTSFIGRAYIGAPEALPDPTVPVSSTTGTYTYHDGSVGADSRSLTVDNGDGTTTTATIASDGKTNTWSYTNQSQLTSDDYMQFHDYTASIDMTSPANQHGSSTIGMELSSSRDMGRLGSRLSWNIFAGMSLNDIHSTKTEIVPAEVTTTTDTYNLYGQVPGSAPYSSPTSASNDVYDNATGGEVVDSSGNDVTTTVNSTVLISNTPISRSTTTALDVTDIADTWTLHGAYLLFRVGPQLNYDISQHLRLSVSAGPALIYAGSTYDVTEDFTTPTGDPIVNQMTDTTARLLPAAYADVTLQYTLSDRAGFYIGAVYQTGGSYTQTADQQTATQSVEASPATASGATATLGATYGSSAVYSAKVDFSNEQGVRTGLTFKF